MAPQLHLLSLGAPLLLTDTGEQVHFDTRKEFALLILLAVEAGHAFSREHLGEVLWPGVSGPRARHSLSQALLAVREKIGRGYLPGVRPSVGLAAGVIDADIGRLDEGQAEIRGPFLEGFDVPRAIGFERWKDAWRARLSPRIHDCLVRQMEAARRVGDFTTLEKLARLLLQFEPLSEEGVRGVMEARAWFGDRTGALSEYARLQVGLAEDLRALPTPELTRLADLLRDRRRVSSQQLSRHQQSERCDRRFEAEPLIGREREFSRLYDAWNEVQGGQPHIVVLLGDAGVGKTTLVNAFVSTCQMEGAAIARAQAYDAERELPFAVLAELIRQLTIQRTIVGADPEALSELTRISPEIVRAFAGVPNPVNWSSEVIQLRLADAFLKTVEAAAEQRPVVLVVDDLHATDNASTAILHTIARKLSHGSTLLILTARADELRTVATASALVSDTSIQALRTLNLEVLSLEASKQLVEAAIVRAGGHSDNVPVPRILLAANGNPLALELLTKEWLAHGSSSLLGDIEALNTHPAATIGMPPAIGAVFDRQIRRLGARARAALDLAAVLGRRLTDLPLYRVVQLRPAVAGQALSRLKEEGLLRQVHGELEFRNELIRAQAYYALPLPTRQQLHHGVAEVLTGRAARKGQPVALEVAWHFLRAGEPKRALSAGLAGARAALNGGAPSEAEQILTTLLPSVSGPRAALDCELLLAQALVDQSKADRALPFLDVLCQEDRLPVRGVAEATRLKAAALYLSATDGGSLYGRAAEVALAAARSTGDSELIAGALLEFARSGLEAGLNGRVKIASAQLSRLLRQRAGQQLPNVWYALGVCQYWSYDLHAASESLGRAVRLLEDSANTVARSLALNAVGVSRYCLCDFSAAGRWLSAALTLARRIGDDYRVSLIAANLATLHNLAGNFREAVQFGHLSTNVGAALNSHPRLLSSYMNLAEAYVLSGEYGRAQHCVDRARQWSEGQKTWRAKVEFLCENANISLMLKNVPLALEGIEILERAVDEKEGAVPEAGIFQKLRLFRLAHTAGPVQAHAAAQAQLKRFASCHPLYYLEVLAMTAWLEKRVYGDLTEQTTRELTSFDTLGARGLKRALAAQGFID